MVLTLDLGLSASADPAQVPSRIIPATNATDFFNFPPQ